MQTWLLPYKAERSPPSKWVHCMSCLSFTSNLSPSKQLDNHANTSVLHSPYQVTNSPSASQKISYFSWNQRFISAVENEEPSSQNSWRALNHMVVSHYPSICWVTLHDGDTANMSTVSGILPLIRTSSSLSLSYNTYSMKTYLHKMTISINENI
jgi:hypothetical protein